ncbi:hypothetical protein AAC387_Pa05g0802 [Persea americana]
MESLFSRLAPSPPLFFLTKKGVRPRATNCFGCLDQSSHLLVWFLLLGWAGSLGGLQSSFFLFVSATLCLLPAWTNIPGTNVRVCCQIGKTNQGKFALDVAVGTLDLYKKLLLL